MPLRDQYSVKYTKLGDYIIYNNLTKLAVARMMTPEAVGRVMVDHLNRIYHTTFRNPEKEKQWYNLFYRMAIEAKEESHPEIRSVTPPKLRETPDEVIAHVQKLQKILSEFIASTESYVQQELARHYEKFPADRKSAFVRNLYYKVESDHDAYVAKLVNSLIWIERELKKPEPDYTEINKLVHFGEDAFKKMISRFTQKTSRHELGVKAYLGFKVLKSEIERLQNKPRPVVTNTTGATYISGSGRLF